MTYVVTQFGIDLESLDLPPAQLEVPRGELSVFLLPTLSEPEYEAPLGVSGAKVCLI